MAAIPAVLDDANGRIWTPPGPPGPLGPLTPGGKWEWVGGKKTIGKEACG